MPIFGGSLLFLCQYIRHYKGSSKKSDKQGLENMPTPQLFMGKLGKQLQLDALGPTFPRPSPSAYPYYNFRPMFNASFFFKISSGSLKSLHPLNYLRATSNSFGLSKISTLHKSP